MQVGMHIGCIGAKNMVFKQIDPKMKMFWRSDAYVFSKVL